MMAKANNIPRRWAAWELARLRDTAAETRKRGVRGGGRLEQLAAELGRSVPAVRSMASRIGAASFPIDPPTTRHPVTGAAVLDRVAQALDHKARVEVRTRTYPSRGMASVSVRFPIGRMSDVLTALAGEDGSDSTQGR